ncbi:hypothetical protein [Pseudomonas sp. Irchel 3A18]|uniref:hypothetical protein n=1 Tax=Pseudomonas sp. Irchel 3A18 TaxID=2008905 RepID=UPI000BA2C7BB|nr:hypothetical protein [Pseudomonas sp. Irchel 3A18]
MKIKMHAGSLAKAMETAQEIEPSINDIAKYLSRHGLGLPDELVGLIAITEYEYDKRIGWHAWLVAVQGFGVVAMTDGPVEA